MERPWVPGQSWETGTGIWMCRTWAPPERPLSPGRHLTNHGGPGPWTNARRAKALRRTAQNVRATSVSARHARPRPLGKLSCLPASATVSHLPHNVPHTDRRRHMSAHFRRLTSKNVRIFPRLLSSSRRRCSSSRRLCSSSRRLCYSRSSRRRSASRAARRSCSSCRRRCRSLSGPGSDRSPPLLRSVARRSWSSS